MELVEFSPDGSSCEFEKDRHLWYLQMMYEILPSHYQCQEINRLTLAYFVISSLNILDALDQVDKERVVNWILSFQAYPKTRGELEKGQFYGFHGSRTSQYPQDDEGDLKYNGSHLASTYCALAILKILGYNLSSIDSESILLSMRALQKPDGSFVPLHVGAENDLRFVYCAGKKQVLFVDPFWFWHEVRKGRYKWGSVKQKLFCVSAAICSMLGSWDGMDQEKAKEYILKCQSYDGGFGLTPGSESHGGGTYCAVASLRLMGFIEDDHISKSSESSIIDLPMLLRWCLQRQAPDGGFQGRSNKASDTCYAFWIGGVLRILGGYRFISKRALYDFLLTCQSEYGGFSKFPGELPDLYHTFYGFTAFSLLGEPGLKPFCVELGIPIIAPLGI
ncbi:PFTB repeat [Dillenia turbinata]|uniref:Geranylgeranyl transferase type-1 subunit beta n=1 Tax=Dillenia turbinata TaxID=194707 RepID=A0AAN8VGD9_9MAGN